jgi:16S rRNA (cytosine1402-N4)-methyltransferase
MSSLSEGQRSLHISVLLSEVVDVLKAKEGGMFLDCTLGGGGHTRAILNASEDSWVVAIDRDNRAVERAKSWADSYGDRLRLIHAPFSRIAEVVGAIKFDGILADLGVSTDQLREGRGFSFADSDTLDMRMDESDGVTAADFINSASERELFLALAEGGVGESARPLARIILANRPYHNAKELAELVRSSHLGKRSHAHGRAPKVHPATVVFQAIRMRINAERSEIGELLSQAPKLVKGSGSRLAVITFHSIEDTLVAREMRNWESAGSYPASWRGARSGKSLGRVSPKKAIVPSEDEVAHNPASRSARLRVFEFA